MTARKWLIWILIGSSSIFVLCVAVVLAFRGIDWVQAELLATSTPYPTYTPYPTHTPALSPTPSIDCAALADFLDALVEVKQDYDRHQEQWDRWMERANAGEVSAEAAIERLEEFSLELGDLRKELNMIRPPREARHAHALFVQMMDEKRRAMALLQGYEETGDEAKRADANAALALGGRLRKEYFYEISDLWERCWGPLPTVTPQ